MADFNILMQYVCKTQIDVQSSNRRPILKYMAVFYFLKSTSHPSGNVFEAMMEKGQDQILDEGFLMTKDKKDLY